MTQDYLVGELSVYLQQLEATAAHEAVVDVTRLRELVEVSSPSGLAAAATRALAVADGICWDSLARGDTAAFARQSRASAELRLFSICARLIADG
jgi:hypothetical protein